MNNRLFLIDGHSLIFKMYYAFLRHPMINSKGADTSILFGFTKYILELIEREKPFYINIPAKEVYNQELEEKILVQGIIDLYAIFEDGKIQFVNGKSIKEGCRDPQ